MKLHQSLRRLAGKLQEKQELRPDFRFILGTVKAVSAGASTLPIGSTGATSTTLLTVTVNGSDIVAPYLASYTPTQGDVVWVVLIDKSPAVLGKPTGFPTF